MHFISARYHPQKSKKVEQVHAQPEVSKKIKRGRTARFFKPMTLWVEGIECEHCARLVMNQLKKIEGIENPNFIPISRDYSDGYVTVDWDMRRGDLPIELIEKVLKKEGFELDKGRMQ